MDKFLLATLGGALIGLSASIMLLVNGRVTGVSGILSSIIDFKKSKDSLEKIYFVIGLVIGGSIIRNFLPQSFDINVSKPMYLVVISGLLVGFGTRLGSGCTSGHGICGISRFSTRSIIATLTFMITGAISVYLTA